MELVESKYYSHGVESEDGGVRSSEVMQLKVKWWSQSSGVTEFKV